jgi:hypothetical protein
VASGLLRTGFKSAIIGAGNNRGKEWKTEVGGFALYLDGGSSTAVNGGRVGAISSSTFLLGFSRFLPTYHAS